MKYPPANFTVYPVLVIVSLELPIVITLTAPITAVENQPTIVEHSAL